MSSEFKLRLMIGLWLCVFANPAVALPGQKVGVSLPISSYTKTTELAKNSGGGSSSVGLATEYSIFVREDLGVFAQVEINLASAGGILFLGGAGGAKWYLTGGENSQYRDSHLSMKTNSRFNAFALFGLGGKSFDFSQEEKTQATSEETTEDTPPGAAPGGEGLDAKNILVGSIIGFMFGFGIEYPVFFDILLSSRVEILQGFASPTAPDITTTSIWLGASFAL